MAVPVVTVPSPVFRTPGQTINFVPELTQGSSVTWTFEDLPTGASGNASTGAITGTLTTLQHKSIRITATNVDGSATVYLVVIVYSNLVTVSSATPLPYSAPLADTLVRLTSNITANRWSFWHNKDRVAYDFNGFTCTYDNARDQTIANGSFETGDTTNWDLSGAPGSSVKALTYIGPPRLADGTYGLEVVIPANSTRTIRTVASYTLTAGREYVVSCWKNKPTGIGLNVSFGGTGLSKNGWNNNKRGTVAEWRFTPSTTVTGPLVIDVVNSNAYEEFIYLDRIRLDTSRCFGITTPHGSFTPGVTGTVGKHLALLNGTLTQGNGANYDCTPVFCRADTGLIINRMTIESHSDATAGASGAGIYCTFLDELSITHNVFRNRVRFIRSREALIDGYTLSLLSSGGKRDIYGNTFDESPQGGIAVSSGSSSSPPVRIENNTFRMTTKFTNGFAIYVLRGVDDEPGGIIRDNFADHSLNPAYGGRGIKFGAVRNWVCTNNYYRLRELKINQEYDGMIVGGCYGTQIENTNPSGDNSTTGDTYHVIDGGTDDSKMGAAIRLSDNGSITNVSYQNVTAICEMAANEFGACLKISSSTLGEYTFENMTFRTTSALLTCDFGANTGTLLLDDCLFEFDDVGSPLKPFEMRNGASSTVVEIRNPSYADAGTRTWLKQPGREVGADGSILSASVTHDCDLTFVDDGVPQSGLTVTIFDKTGAEVFSGTTDVAGKVTPNLVEYRVDLSAVTTDTPHDITTDFGDGTAHTLDLSDATRESTFDVGDEGEPESPISYVDIGTASDTISVTYPTLAAGDMLILANTWKNANRLMTTLGGWSQISATGGDGPEVSTIDDDGQIALCAAYKQADGTETGSQTLSYTFNGSPSSVGPGIPRILSYRKSPAAVWNVQVTNGADNVAGTTYSVTGHQSLAVAPGDVVLVITGVNTDNYTYSSHALSIAGVTFGAATIRLAAVSGSGRDNGHVIAEFPVTAGNVSAVPTFTMTSSGTAGTAPSGGSIFVRLRQIGGTTPEPPTITSPSTPNYATSIPEGQQVVATYTATGTPGPTWSLSGTDNARFQMVGNTLRFITAPDFEAPNDSNTDNVYLTIVTATNSSGSHASTTTVTVTDVNEPPTALELSNDEVTHNLDTSGGYSVGTLTTTDPDAGDTHTYTITGGDDEELFSIGGDDDDELILTAGTTNFNTQPSYSVQVMSTDSGGLTIVEDFTITVEVVTVIEFTPLDIVVEFGDFEIEGGVRTTISTKPHFTWFAPWKGPLYDKAHVLEEAGGDLFLPDEDEVLTTARYGARNSDVIDSANNNHGTIVGLDTLLAWQIPGILFNDPDGYVIVPDYVHSLTAFSFGMRITTSTVSGTQALMGQWGAATTRSWLLSLVDGKPDLKLSSNGTDTEVHHTGQTSIADGFEHHVFITWGAGTPKIYVDGVQQAVTITVDTAMTALFESSAPMVIGAMLSGETVILPTTGTIRDVRAHNEETSGANVAVIDAEVTAYTTNLIVHLRMTYAPTVGTVTLPDESVVMLGELYGPNLTLEGTLPADLPDDPLYSILVFRARDADGQPLAGISINIRVVKAPSGQGTLFSNAVITKVTDADGFARFTVPKGADLKYWINEQWKNLDDVGLTDDIVYVDNWIGHP